MYPDIMLPLEEFVVDKIDHVAMDCVLKHRYNDTEL